MPGRLVSSRVNLGRAKGRNRLARFARGGWLLFLDADMAPDSPEFLKVYLDLIAAHAPAVAFGGFSLDQAPDKAEHALHRRMALASDCASAEVRRDHPEKHVFTSNLLVRRDVFAAQPFDESFAGWGWEDVEWAMRVARHHWITHIDNTATHLGLDDAELQALLMAQPSALGDRRLTAAAQRAFDKLMASMPATLRTQAESIRARLHVDPTGWWETGEDLSMLSIVQDAVSRERQLAFDYVRGDGQRSAVPPSQRFRHSPGG